LDNSSNAGKRHPFYTCPTITDQSTTSFIQPYTFLN